MAYFDSVPDIGYEGKRSKNRFAFKFYDSDEVIGGKKMIDNMKFSVAFWHTMNYEGADMFGLPTAHRPWIRGKDAISIALNRVDALFEFCKKLGVRYFCFHDRDIAPEGKTLRETNRNLDRVVEHMKEHMKESGIKPLWVTANLFSNPRYVHGAATSCNADVFAYAAAQVKKAMDIAKELDAQGYVFWGGREGYETLLNTDMKLEMDNLARFLYMAVEYAKNVNFTGQLLIEPKPKEPTKHQYDFDVATAYAFLQRYGLVEYFRFNIESNHAILAGHTFHHELRYARIMGMLGSIDANQGDPLLGWDVDRFPTNLYEAVLSMYEVIKNGGLHKGGLNFDAKVRRASFKDEDLFLAYIAGMDTLAAGWKIANALLEDGVIERYISERYSSYKDGIGSRIVSGNVSFEELEEYIMDKEKIENLSGFQEYLESVVNQYILDYGG